MPNEPNVQYETNLQAKEIDVRGRGEHEVQNKGLEFPWSNRPVW